MKLRLFFVSILIFLSIFLLWFYAKDLMECKFGVFQDNKSFGDIFNALSSLFTALAFAGLIVTIIIQRRDLNAQNKINTIQNFENTFFRLLEQHHRIIDSFVVEIKPNEKNDKTEPYPDERDKVTQLDAFDFLAKDFKYRFDKVKEIRFSFDESYQNIFTHSFLHYTYRKYGYMLGHYYRNLYHIIKFIDDDKSLKSFEEKYKYIKILRAQLSAPEINLIAWNGLTYHGAAFKPLIEKYKLLKNMNFIYEMVDLRWLSSEYPHIRKSIWLDNPLFFIGTEFESEIKQFEKEEKIIN